MHRGDTTFLLFVLSVAVVLGQYATAGDDPISRSVSSQRKSEAHLKIPQAGDHMIDDPQQQHSRTSHHSTADEQHIRQQNTDTTIPTKTNSEQSINQNTPKGKKVVNQVETSLLKMFGLSSRPRPTDKIVIPQYMIELYKERAGVDEVHLNVNSRQNNVQRFPGNTIRSYYHEEIEYETQNPPLPVHKTVLHFNLSHFPQDETYEGSELRIYRHRANDSNKFSYQSSSNNDTTSINNLHRINVYEIIKPATKTQESITRLIDTRQVYPHRSKWESFDIEPALKKWRNKPHLNHGLEVHYTDLNGDIPELEHVRLRRSISNTDNSWSSEQPVLVLYSDDGKDKHVRQKRQADNNESKKKKKSKDRERAKDRKKRKNHCKRHPLFVDFTSVGWTDWIIAPSGYDAYFCHGECPFYMPDHLNATNHAIVQNMVHSVNPQAAPKPCCVPTELSAIAMLYMDDIGKVVLKTYQEMVVDACGCR